MLIDFVFWFQFQFWFWFQVDFGDIPVYYKVFTLYCIHINTV